MLSKKPSPVIGKLSNLVMSGAIWDNSSSSTSPRSSLEFKILSPRGPINCDLTGVGLGIVAAMEKYSDDKTQILASKPFCHRNSNRSDPIPVNSPPNKGGGVEEKEEDSLEDYTFVTGRGADNKRFTRVYYDGSGQKKESDWTRPKRNHTSLFTVSPTRFGDLPTCQADDFLSNCHMCQKKLLGKDVYMYRGEMGFCSPECRYKQIVKDEKKEKFCSAELAPSSRSAVISSSPCQNNGLMFSPGILAI